MMHGRFIAVVGPSGVGKDSVMAGLNVLSPCPAIARRVITRDPALGGEAFDAVSVPAFDAMRDAGEFVLYWGAHGLFYGIRETIRNDLARGQDMLVNLSRTVLTAADAAFPGMVVLNLTASPDVLAERLAGRGRERPQDIAERLSRSVADFPAGLDVRTISNDGTLDATVAVARSALYPERA
jgi:ribose 1,5-bisphosphokinase